jgi:toxin YoeB
MYEIDYSDEAMKGLAKLKKSEPKAFEKAKRLIEEIRNNPYTGTGKPERLKGTTVPTWSREITKKHRLVYEIDDKSIRVYILTSYGHYDDK